MISKQLNYYSDTIESINKELEIEYGSPAFFYNKEHNCNFSTKDDSYNQSLDKDFKVQARFKCNLVWLIQYTKYGEDVNDLIDTLLPTFYNLDIPSGNASINIAVKDNNEATIQYIVDSKVVTEETTKTVLPYSLLLNCNHDFATNKFTISIADQPTI